MLQVRDLPLQLFAPLAPHADGAKLLARFIESSAKHFFGQRLQIFVRWIAKRQSTVLRRTAVEWQSPPPMFCRKVRYFLLQLRGDFRYFFFKFAGIRAPRTENSLAANRLVIPR